MGLRVAVDNHLWIVRKKATMAASMRPRLVAVDNASTLTGNL